MKAVVLETRGREAAILTHDGLVRRVKGIYQTGQVFDYIEPARASALQWVAAVLIAAILLTGSAGMWINANYVAYAEVSLDVNPSILYTLNRRNRVLSVEAVNEDAEAVVEALKVQNVRFATIGDAVEMTLDVLEDQGYLDSASQDYVLAGVSADDSRRQDQLESQVRGAIARKMEEDPTLEYQIERTDRDTAKEARDQGMTPGRYAAWQEEGEDSQVESYREMPVKAIIGGEFPAEEQTREEAGPEPAEAMAVPAEDKTSAPSEPEAQVREENVTELKPDSETPTGNEALPEADTRSESEGSVEPQAGTESRQATQESSRSEQTESKDAPSEGNRSQSRSESQPSSGGGRRESGAGARGGNPGGQR